MRLSMSTQTIKANMPASIRKVLLLLSALASLSVLWSCFASDPDAEEYLNLTLNASYADYDTVSIRLVEAGDTDKVLEVVWNDKIPEPAKFPRHKLTSAKGRDFIIQIRCYNARHELLMSKNVKVEGKKPDPAVVLVPELRLLGLKASTGSLSPPFTPSGLTYTVEVAETVANLTLTATALDAGNALSIDGASANWGVGVSKDLAIGPNPFLLTVSTKDGKKSVTYQVNVIRGRIIPPAEVTGVSLTDTALTLYTGDDPTPLTAKVDPPGAALEWTSLDGNVASVDVLGRVKPVGPGDTKVSVKAGNYSASATIKVKRDVPVLSVGDNTAVKPGTEVVFTINITQEHGTLVSFKYDLNGDTTWDEIDTTDIPASLSLKHTYAAAGNFLARFEVKDSEGNVATASRAITVDNSAFQIAILSPKEDTLINTRSILVKYMVNDTPLEKTFSDLPEGTTLVTVDTGTGTEKRSASRNVTVDTRPPAAPVFTGSPISTTLRPTWTWRSGGEGNGQFRAALDSSGLAVATPGTATTFTSPANLIPGGHVLWVQERDPVGNWSEPGKFALSIKVPDTTPPNAPRITAPASTDKAPKWTWTTGDGGGAGVFNHKLGDSTLAGATETTALEFTLADAPVNGRAYTLYVAERDSGGFWSKTASATITFDATRPIVTIALPAPGGTNVTFYTTQSVLPFSGTVSGPNPIERVRFKINLVDAAEAVFDKGNWTIAAVPVSENSVTIVTVIATDNLGISGEATLNVLRDNTNPGMPTLTTSPATPTKATTGGFAWTKGADNVNGSGLNDRYRWSWDSATWNETTQTLVSALALKEGANTFHVQEQDKAGNWSGSAPRIVLADFTGPKVAITAPVGGSTRGTIHVTVTGTASDSLTKVVSVQVTGQESGNGAATLAANGTWTTGSLVLRGSGLDTLIATATDEVGNVSTHSVTVTVNVALSTLDIQYPTEGMFYNKDTLTVRYTVNSGAEQKQLFTLAAVGNNALEVVSPPNEAGQVARKTVTVFRDVVAPVTAPTLTAVRTPTNGNAVWNIAAGADNLGGSGLATPALYRYSTNGGTTYTALAAGATAITMTNPAEGAYTALVQQQDRAGNWSAASAGVAITIDKTAPVMTVVAPVNGLITNVTTVTLSCRAGTTNMPGKNPTLVPGANTLHCDSTDPAGNLGRTSITVYSAPNALFVDGNAPFGGDGSTWGKAFKTIPEAMTAWAAGKEIWVAAGTYLTPATDEGFVTRTGMKFYGGFPSNGSAWATTMRTFAAADTTVLESGQRHIFTMAGTSASNRVTNVLVDGFKVHYSNATFAGAGFNMTYASGITVQKTVISHNLGQGQGVSSSNSSYTFDQCKFTGHGFYSSIVSASGAGTTVFTNSEFSGNTFPANYIIQVVLDGVTSATFTNTLFLDPLLDATPTSDNHYISFNNGAGTLNITGCTFAAKNPPAFLVPAGTAGTRTPNSFPP